MYLATGEDQSCSTALALAPERQIQASIAACTGAESFFTAFLTGALFFGVCAATAFAAAFLTAAFFRAGAVFFAIPEDACKLTGPLRPSDTSLRILKHFSCVRRTC